MKNSTFIIYAHKNFSHFIVFLLVIVISIYIPNMVKLFLLICWFYKDKIYYNTIY